MKQKGFTLIELLVVIAIIGLLSSLAVVSLNDARNKAKDAQIKSDLSQFRTYMAVKYELGVFSGLTNPADLVATEMTLVTPPLSAPSGCGAYVVTPGTETPKTTWSAHGPLCTTPANAFCVDSTGVARIVLTPATPTSACPVAL
ncbi:MAG: type II secretion system protein [Patescibacteria group bacterium]